RRGWSGAPWLNPDGLLAALHGLLPDRYDKRIRVASSPGVGGPNTPDRIGDIGPTSEATTRPSGQASPRAGDFCDPLASNNEHLEAGLCLQNEQLEAGACSSQRRPAGISWRPERSRALTH